MEKEEEDEKDRKKSQKGFFDTAADHARWVNGIIYNQLYLRIIIPFCKFLNNCYLLEKIQDKKYIKIIV